MRLTLGLSVIAVVVAFLQLHEVNTLAIVGSVLLLVASLIATFSVVISRDRKKLEADVSGLVGVEFIGCIAYVLKFFGTSAFSMTVCIVVSGLAIAFVLLIFCSTKIER
jgi:hypothetical protein